MISAGHRCRSPANHSANATHHIASHSSHSVTNAACTTNHFDNADTYAVQRTAMSDCTLDPLTTLTAVTHNLIDQLVRDMIQLTQTLRQAQAHLVHNEDRDLGYYQRHYQHSDYRHFDLLPLGA